MKQFFSIFKFELSGQLKSKLFIGMTLFFVVIIAGVLSFPRVSEMIKGDKEAPQVTVESALVQNNVAISDATGGDTSSLETYFVNAMPQSKFTVVGNDETAIRAQVDEGMFDYAILIEGPLKYKYFVKDIGMYDVTDSVINEVMLTKYRFDEMERLGVPLSDAQSLLGANIQMELVQTGKNQMESFFYTYVLIFALYMAIMIYGQLVATNVASEKSSRAMELLITSAKPTNLMFGKIIGSGLAGLTQLGAIFVSASLFFNFNRIYWADNYFVLSIFDMPTSILLYTLLFFALGYFLYSFMYGALGSLASRMEDINTSVLPVTFLFIIAFMVVMFSMSSGNVDSLLMKVCSFIPFTSPMAMFARIAMSNVPPIEIIISIIILVASTIAIGYISAGIYRMGVLLYGKPPKIGELFNMIRSQTIKG